MKFVTEANQLTITLEGFEQLWALKRHIHVPRTAIAEVDYLAQQPSLQDYRGYLRFSGTSLPWRFLAGSYVRKGKREFWYVRMRQPGVLIITLKTSASGYDTIRLSCTAEIAQSIADWWRERK